jgi:hypothetical protein
MPFYELSTRVHRDGRFVKVIRCGFLVLIPKIYNENVPPEYAYPSICQDVFKLTPVMAMNDATVTVSVHELCDRAVLDDIWGWYAFVRRLL